MSEPNYENCKNCKKCEKCDHHTYKSGWNFLCMNCGHEQKPPPEPPIFKCEECGKTRPHNEGAWICIDCCYYHDELNAGRICTKCNGFIDKDKKNKLCDSCDPEVTLHCEICHVEIESGWACDNYECDICQGCDVCKTTS